MLQNERCLLRPLEESDTSNLLAVAIERPDLVRYSPYAIHTPEALAQFVASSLQDRETAFRYPWIIFDKATQAYAGSTSFANVSNKDLRLEIGWTWIGAAFQRTGLNRNAKFLLLEYAFDILGFERVEFRTDARNEASRAAMEKMGALYEGALRSHTLMPDGHRRTTVYYSILRPEWEERRPSFLRK